LTCKTALFYAHPARSRDCKTIFIGSTPDGVVSAGDRPSLPICPFRAFGRVAKADAAFFAPIHVGHLCSADYARQALCASGCRVADVSSWVEQCSCFRLGGGPDL